jgi:hypothetical protein
MNMTEKLQKSGAKGLPTEFFYRLQGADVDFDPADPITSRHTTRCPPSSLEA